jgi:hypothetical protein
MEPLDVEPAAWGNPKKSALGRFDNVRAHIIALGTKEPQTLRRIGGWNVVTLEAVARRASVDEVIELIGAPCGHGVKVIDLKPTARGRLGHAAVTTPAAERGPHGRPRLCRDRHLRRRQRAARESGKRDEDGGAPLIELGKKATRIRGEALLTRKQPGQLLVLALKPAELLLLLGDLSAEAAHRWREYLRLLRFDVSHERRELPLLGLRQRARELLVAEAIQPGLTVLRPAHHGSCTIPAGGAEGNTGTAASGSREYSGQGAFSCANSGARQRPLSSPGQPTGRSAVRRCRAKRGGTHRRLERSSIGASAERAR